MIESLSHLTFVVEDVDRMAHFLRTIFDAQEVYDSGGKNFSLSYEKFFLIGGTWIAVMAGPPVAERSYNHVAFRVPEPDFEAHAARIRELGVEVKAGRKRQRGEGRSIYFYDYDNHLFELHTGTLTARLAAYTGV